MAINIFDRSLYKRNFNRIAPDVDFLYQHAAEIVLENILQSQDVLLYGYFPIKTNYKNLTIHDYDEEEIPNNLPNYDCIASNLSLHFINDIEKTLRDYKTHLNDKGKFIATFIGGNSLHELRKTLMDTDIEIFGGAAQRVIPMIDVKDAGRLLQKTGFKDPISFSEVVSAQYPSLRSLLREIKKMGQGNFLVNRDGKYLSRNYLERAETKYGNITVTFDIITMIGTNR